MLGVGPEDVYLSPAPLYHAAPLRFCLAFHQLGATVVVMERFDAADALRAHRRARVTAHPDGPDDVRAPAASLPARPSARDDLSSLRFALHAAAPCPPEIKRQMIEWWGPVIHEYYASTEGCGSTWITSDDWLTHPGSVGPGR